MAKETNYYSFKPSAVCCERGLVFIKCARVPSLSASVCCAADGRLSPQLQRDGGHLRGLLERSRGQSGSQRVRRICKCTPLGLERRW